MVSIRPDVSFHLTRLDGLQVQKRGIVSVESNIPVLVVETD
ncbi:MAG: hypothetical protein R3C05_22060 [Pirellulaceae bacterium]